MWRFRGYTLINMLGLAIGMACVILIMLYVQSELSYDTFHTYKDQIYRLNIQVRNPQTGDVATRAIGPYRLAKELKVDFEDMPHIVRFAPQGRELIEHNDENYVEQNMTFADEDVFEVFSFPLRRGDPKTVLKDPYSIVVTEEIARKYFGDADPIGKTLRMRDSDFAITGIMEEVPENSQFQFNIIASMNCAEQVFSRIVLENWGEGSVETFAMIPEGKKASDYSERLAEFIGVKLESWKSFSPEVKMQALSSIYLHSQDISSFSNGGDITYVYAFSLIALFILIIGCINFMNLSTARSSLRAKEVGLRKVVGAMRQQLIGQFLSESILMALLSMLIGLVLASLALPAFNEIADKEFISFSLLGTNMLIGLVLITLFVGLAAGSYPALILSAFEPISVLGGKLNIGFKGTSLRKILVFFQFATSIFLLIATGIVYTQLQYCKNLDLGYDRDHVMVLGPSTDLRAKYDEFRAELLKNPQIVNAAGSSRVPPGRLSSSLTARPEGVPEDQQRGMQTVWTDFEFIETMGLEMASGRSFSRDFPADKQSGFILNEAAVKSIGWDNESALGKTFGSAEITDWNSGQWVERDGKVIGVLKDFHFESLREKIVPTVYFVAPYMAWNYVIRVRPERLTETINFVEETWTAFDPGNPFNYTFVDDNFAQLYLAEERQGKIFGIFALLAIFISCLGLIGLASFTAERRKKEIGIRKVLGASSFNLIVLLSREFTILVGIAFAITAPLSYLIMENWLENFVYRSPISVLLFIAAGGLAVLIAWLTVGYQTAKAAYSNPVKSLKYE